MSGHVLRRLGDLESSKFHSQVLEWGEIPSSIAMDSASSRQQCANSTWSLPWVYQAPKIT